MHLHFPRLLIHGDYLGIHGYGAHIRSHLRLLEESEIQFFLIRRTFDLNQISTDEARQWKNLEILKPLHGDIVLHFMEAAYIRTFEGCKNIAYTMWEVDRLPDYASSLSPDLSWVETLNSCDEVWTGSSFSKDIFQRSGIRKPISIVPWAIRPLTVSTNTVQSLPSYRLPPWQMKKSLHRNFRPVFEFIAKAPGSKFLASTGYWFFEKIEGLLLSAKALRILLWRKQTIQLNSPEVFTLLCVNTYNERKNIPDFISAIEFAFRSSDRVRVILKTYHALDTFWIRLTLMKDLISQMEALKISDAPGIDLIFDSLDENEMHCLFENSHLFVNTSKGEGIGGGVLQAMASGMPVATHLFSSLSDFCNQENSFIYDYSLEPVKWKFNFYGLRQRWARPNLDSLIQGLQRAYNLWRSNSGEWNILQSKARESAQSYGDPKKVLGIYRQLLKEG